MSDIFEPRSEPARRLYLALKDEARHRSERSLDDWIRLERERMWKEARDYAMMYSLPAPTIDEIKKAESSACGHVDYAEKFAHYVAALLSKP